MVCSRPSTPARHKRQPWRQLPTPSKTSSYGTHPPCLALPPLESVKVWRLLLLLLLRVVVATLAFDVMTGVANDCWSLTAAWKQSCRSQGSSLMLLAPLRLGIYG